MALLTVIIQYNLEKCPFIIKLMMKGHFFVSITLGG